MRLASSCPWVAAPLSRSGGRAGENHGKEAARLLFTFIVSVLEALVGPRIPYLVTQPRSRCLFFPWYLHVSKRRNLEKRLQKNVRSFLGRGRAHFPEQRLVIEPTNLYALVFLRMTYAFRVTCLSRLNVTELTSVTVLWAPPAFSPSPFPKP